MTELKTLKDIEVILAVKKFPYGEFEDVISKEDLKTEVIKWVKQLNHEHKGEAEEGAIYFINNFFNLTSEDFK